MKRLGTLPGGQRASATGFNDSGLIVGWSQTGTRPAASDPRRDEWFIRPGHAFLYSHGTMQDLNSLSDGGSEWELRKANAISDQGHIVGFGYHNKMIGAFLMIHNHVTDLGTFVPNGGSSYALAVNNRGEAVGAAYLDATGAGNFRACIFRDGRAWNLNGMIDAAGWVLSEATGINDKGQIVGWGLLGKKEHEIDVLLFLAPELINAGIVDARFSLWRIGHQNQLESAHLLAGC